MAKQDDYTRYTIRIPTPLYERVKAAAGEASVNAEIIARLDRTFTAEQSPVVKALTEEPEISSRTAEKLMRAMFNALAKMHPDTKLEDMARFLEGGKGPSDD